MEEMEMKSEQIVCLQNEELIDLETLRKVLLTLLDFRTYMSKVAETNEKVRFELEPLENAFVEAVGRHEPLLQRYLSGEWQTEEYGTTIEQFIDPSQMDAEQFVVEGQELISDPSGSYTIAEKKDVMAIAAAEVVTHSYRDGLYICGWDGCEYQTSSRRHINNHKLVHTGDSEYSCSFGECGKRFKTQNELDAHSQIHDSDEPYPCVWHNCGYRASTPASLKAHMKVHMDRKYACSIPNCSKEFNKETERNEHQQSHYETVQQAGEEAGTSNQQPTRPQNVSGVTPQVTLATLSGSGQQVQIISNQPNGQMVGQQVTLVQMQQPPPNSQKNNHSQQQNVTTINAGNHGDRVVQNVVTPVTPVSNVNTNTGGGANQTVAAASIMSGSLFKCNNETCNAYFSTVYDLKQHQLTHAKSEKPWKCDYDNCDYSAYSKTALNEHKVTHTNERNFHCPVAGCGRKYKTRKGLWDHQHTHRDDKPFACSFPNCTYKAVSSSYLRSHMRAHKEHSQKDPNIVMVSSIPPQNGVVQTGQITSNAPVIQVSKGQMVNQQAAPQQQQFFAPGTIIQHPNGKQEFFCGILNCGQSFDNQVNYLNHVKTHAPVNNMQQIQTPIQISTQPSAPPPQPPAPPKTPSASKNRSRNPDLAKFKCEFEGCTSAYKLRRNLKDHMIRHTILEKPYRCDWPGCDYGSYKSTNVAKHKSVHSDERRFGCQYFNCTKRFKTREGLRKHMLSHHKVNRADIP